MSKDIYYSRDGQFFNAESPSEFCLEPGDIYYQGESEEIKPIELIDKWAADSIIEGMSEALYEMVGESSLNSMSVTDESAMELQKLINEWVSTNIEISCYRIVNVKKITHGDGKESENEQRD